MTIDCTLRLLRILTRFTIVIHIALFPVILYGFGFLNIVVSCLLFIPCIQFNLMQALYRMNKKYLYGLSVHQPVVEPVVVETPPISRTDSNIYTPLLNLEAHPPAPQPRKNYCSRLTHVVVNYIKMHPFIFLIEILIVGALCYFLEMMMGGICVFKHGRMNIQD